MNKIGLAVHGLTVDGPCVDMGGVYAQLSMRNRDGDILFFNATARGLEAIEDELFGMRQRIEEIENEADARDEQAIRSAVERSW